MSLLGYIRAKRRREALSNALRESYEPGDPGFDPNISPETAEYDPGAAFQEEAGMGATQGGPNVRNALNMLYQGEGDQPVQAFDIENALMDRQTKSSMANREGRDIEKIKYLESLYQADPTGKYTRALVGLRNPQFLDVGSGYKTPVPGDPTRTTDVAGGTRQLKPAETPEYKEASAAAQKVGADLGEAQSELVQMEANLPRLNDVVDQLSVLGKKATYTKAGQLKDAFMRESGMGVGEGAIARKEYTSTVNNEVLPLLRLTFGAAFTVPEGESLKATLGDVNASPEEKEAVLRAFIDNKIAQIEVKRRRTGQPQYKIGQITIAPNGQKVIIRSLKPDGTPDNVDPL